MTNRRGAIAGARLTEALIDLAAAGLRTHCQDYELAHLWLSERDHEREVAARLCGGCPAELQCWDAARARDERFGVWGGIDRTRRANGKGKIETPP
jgi:transcription factor WhiB